MRYNIKANFGVNLINPYITDQKRPEHRSLELTIVSSKVRVGTFSVENRRPRLPLNGLFTMDRQSVAGLCRDVELRRRR